MNLDDIQLLIFDWDGTLADSIGQIVTTMQQAIVALELPSRSDQQLGELVGLGFIEGLRHLYPELNPQQVMALIMEYRRQAPSVAYAAPLFAGADRMLFDLSDAGYQLAVATGKSREGLARSLQTHEHIADLFAITRCADESADKPNPLMLEQILTATGIAPEAALMIGDTEYDIAMAQAIGMPAVGVRTGVHAPERLSRAGAAEVFADVRELPAWLGRGRR